MPADWDAQKAAYKKAKRQREARQRSANAQDQAKAGVKQARQARTEPSISAQDEAKVQARQNRRPANTPTVDPQDSAKTQVRQGRPRPSNAVNAGDDAKTQARQRLQRPDPSVDASADAAQAAQIKSGRTERAVAEKQVVAEFPPNARVPVQFGPFTGGLVTNAGAILDQDECSEMTDWNILPSGDLISRRGFTRQIGFNYAKGEIRQILDAYVPSGSYGWRTIITDDEGYVYCIEAGESFLKPIFKSTNRCRCVPFANKLAVFDEDYAKYWDGSWSATGSEMVTDGDMSVPGSWTCDPSWSVGGGVGSYDGNGAYGGEICQNVSATAGKIYRVEYTVTNWTLDTVAAANVHKVRLGGTSPYCMSQEYEGNGTFTNYLICGAIDSWLYIVAAAGCGYDFDIDNVSVKEVDPIPIVYDDGTGENGFMYALENQRFSDQDIYGSEGGAPTGTTRAGTEFVTASFGTGRTLAPTFMSARLRKNGSDVNGTVLDGVAVFLGICDTSNNTMYEAKVSDDAGSDLSSSAFVSFEVFFTTAHKTTDLSPATTYYAYVRIEGGDSTAYVEVQKEETTDSNLGVRTYDAATTTWSAKTANYVHAIDVKPGMPPKLYYGVVNSGRLFGYEGEDGDNPSYLWYPAFGNLFDWSTPYNAGYDDLGDPIGTLSSMYKTLWIWGTKERPFLLRQTGEIPWSYPMFVNWAYGYDWSIVDTPQGPFFVMRSGIYSLKSVDTYRDVQSAKHAPGMSDAITTGWDADYDADRDKYVVGYDPLENVIVFKANEDSTEAFVLFLNAMASREAGAAQTTYHPGGKWDLYYSPSSRLATAFGNSGGYLWYGDSSGFLWRLDGTASVDTNGSVPDTIQPTLETARFTTRFGQYRALMVSPNYYSEKANFTIDFYKDFAETLWDSIAFDSGDNTTQWATATGYTATTSKVWARNGNYYTCSQNHTSSANDEPGIGENWEDYWDLTTEYFKDRDYAVFNFRNLKLGISSVGGTDNERLCIRDIIVLCENLGGF